jgi:ketosteroid isomerase-like protein
MKTRTIIFTLVFLGGIIGACTRPALNTDDEALVLSTDSLVNLWNQAWDSGNVDEISALFADDALALSDSTAIFGKDSITAQWIKPNAYFIKNLKVEKLIDKVTPEMAFYSGFYDLDVMDSDSLISKESGNVTYIWQKQADNSWKLELVHLGTY